MNIEISRKQFLRGGFRAGSDMNDANRPAPEEAVRANINSHCLSISGTMCRLCEDECDRGAISFQLMTAGRSVPMVAEDRCNGCMDCKAVCPAQAIEPILQSGLAIEETAP